MGRKADKRGKDRPRTIVLSGDVAEIAQKLADLNKLSSTLSELLRHNYGFGDKLDEKKRELETTHQQRVALQRKEKDLAAVIDQLENEFVKSQTVIRPKLEEKIALLGGRLATAEQKLALGIFPAMYRSQIENLKLMIAEEERKLEELN